MGKRIFLALPVSPEVIHSFTCIQEQLKKNNLYSKINWVLPHNFHVTLQFLGEINNGQLDILLDVLSHVSKKFSPFQFEVDSLDAFPSITHPKTIVVKLFEHERLTNRLHKELTDVLVNKGILVDLKKWMPHVTLGRNKNDQRLRGLDNAKLPPISWHVEHIQTVQSDLCAEGPVYTVIHSYTLGTK